MDCIRNRVITELSRPPIGANRECDYYPCHYDGQECTFCYCPFYPCHDEDLGKMITGRRGNPVWSGKDCLLIHHPDTVAYVHAALKDEWPCSEERLRAVLSESKNIFFKE